MTTLKDYLEAMDERDNIKRTLIYNYIDNADPADLYDLLADFNITEEDDISDFDESEVKDYLIDYLMDLSLADLKEVLGMD